MKNKEINFALRQWLTLYLKVIYGKRENNISQKRNIRVRAMENWKQTSLFAYEDNLTLENIMSGLKTLGEPTPLNLIQKGIEKFSKKGDLVLDPYCSNGSAGLVALEMERRAVLSDISKLTVRTVRSFFNSFDSDHILALWLKIETALAEPLEGNKANLHEFLHAGIPNLPAFAELKKKRVEEVSRLFHPEDLEVLQKLYTEILQVNDQTCQEIFQVILMWILNDTSQLQNSKNGKKYYLSQVYKPRKPVSIFRHRLELFLKYQKLITTELLKKVPIPETYLSSVYNLEFLPPESVDYILLYLPRINGYSRQAENYLSELFAGDFTDYAKELIINLDYRGRYQLATDLSRLLKEMERVLKENSYMTVIFSGHYILLSTLIRTTQGEGWQLVQGEVEMVKGGQSEEYPVMSLTLQRKKQNTVLGSLNKMKVETLYDTEEAILRKIDQYLSYQTTASTEEIQRYLIENYLHDCLIDKPLEDLLMENYLWSGKYWLKPSLEQKHELFGRRKLVMHKRFNAFVAEMAYHFLREEDNFLSYEDLFAKFIMIKPRTIFHTPYFRLLMEQCEKDGVKLQTLVQEYLEARKKDQFEKLTKVLRRILKKDRAFMEVAKGKVVGLTEWPKDRFFKIYLELFEKAKKRNDIPEVRLMARKALDLLPNVTYLDERKKAKLMEYLMRSEGV